MPAVLLAGSAVAVLVITGFDGLYGQDSFAYYHYATGPLRHALLRLQALPAFFWPPGYPLAVALASGGVGVTPLAGQIVSVIAGAAVPAFTVLLAGEMVRQDGSNPAAGMRRSTAIPLVAGLVVVVTGQLLQSSVVVMADTLGLAAATASVWALVRYRRTLQGRWLVISAAAFALAIITRWIYALVAFPFMVWALVLLARGPRRRALLHGAAAAAAATLILGPILIPAISGLLAGGNASFAGDLQVYSWNPLNALRRTFTTGDGQLAYQLPNGLFYGIAPAQWWYFGPVLAALIVPGLWAVWRRRTGLIAALLCIWVAVVYAFHAGAPWQNPRFALAYLPPLAILIAIGFAQLRATTDVRIRWAAAVWLFSGLALAVAGSAVLSDRFIERKQNDVATVRWIEQLAPPRAQLLTFGLTATFQEYGRLPARDLSEIDSSTLAGLVSDGRPTLVLLDVAGIERQWSGRPPWTNYRTLRDGTGLQRLGARGNYTLFVVSGTGP